MTNTDDVRTIGGTWQLRIANAPWFGVCHGTCDRELGMTAKDTYIKRGELVARRISGATSDEFYCIPCVTALIQADEIAFFEPKEAQP